MQSRSGVSFSAYSHLRAQHFFGRVDFSRAYTSVKALNVIEVVPPSNIVLTNGQLKNPLLEFYFNSPSGLAGRMACLEGLGSSPSSTLSQGNDITQTLQHLHFLMYRIRRRANKEAGVTITEHRFGWMLLKL